MKRRCYNPNNDSYIHYGGRGITVCDEWLDRENGFNNFYNWSMKNGYDDTLSIDRIDNNGPYAPWNCRWVTIKVQANNKRTNHLLTYDRYSFTISEWSEICELNPDAIIDRLEKGWELGKILTTPIHNKHGSRMIVIPPEYLQYNKYRETD